MEVTKLVKSKKSKMQLLQMFIAFVVVFAMLLTVTVASAFTGRATGVGQIDFTGSVNVVQAAVNMTSAQFEVVDNVGEYNFNLDYNDNYAIGSNYMYGDIQGKYGIMSLPSNGGTPDIEYTVTSADTTPVYISLELEFRFYPDANFDYDIDLEDKEQWGVYPVFDSTNLSTQTEVSDRSASGADTDYRRDWSWSGTIAGVGTIVTTVPTAKYVYIAGAGNSYFAKTYKIFVISDTWQYTGIDSSPSKTINLSDIVSEFRFEKERYIASSGTYYSAVPILTDGELRLSTTCKASIVMFTDDF